MTLAADQGVAGASSDSDDRDPSPEPARRALQWAVLGLPVLVFVLGAWSYRFMLDDGFINLRIVDQLLSGHGPVFNQGQRVEAYTSPLWIAVLAVADVLLPVRLEWISVGGGIVLGAVGLALAMAAGVALWRGPSDRRAGPGRELFVPAGAAALAVLPPLWAMSASGLENGLSSCWIGGAALGLARWARDRSRPGRALLVVVGLGPLVRPDLGIFTVTMLAVLVVGVWADGRRAVLRVLAWSLAVPVAYQVFRMGYFGLLVPNTALAKSAGATRWDLGWHYLRDTVDPYWLWLPLILLGVGVAWPLVQRLRAGRGQVTGAGRRRGLADPADRLLAVGGALAAGGALSILYVVAIGGDYVHSRLLLPGLFGLLVPVAVVPLRRAHALGLATLAWAVVALAFLRSPEDKPFTLLPPKTAHPVTLADFDWGPGGSARQWFTGDGVYFSQQKLPVQPPPGQERPVVMSYGIGLTGYGLGTDVDIVDILGLAQPLAAHLELQRRGYTGHEKNLPAPWLAALTTAPGSKVTESMFPVPPPIGPPGHKARIVRQDDPGDQTFAQRVAIARHVLSCQAVRDFRSTYQAPLTAGRFWSNLTGAVGTTRFGLPPEPRAARRALC